MLASMSVHEYVDRAQWSTGTRTVRVLECLRNLIKKKTCLQWGGCVPVGRCRQPRASSRLGNDQTCNAHNLPINPNSIIGTRRSRKFNHTPSPPALFLSLSLKNPPRTLTRVINRAHTHHATKGKNTTP